MTPVAFTVDESLPVLDYADVSVSLKDPSGAVVSSQHAASGSLRLSQVVTGPGTYTLEVKDESADVPVGDVGPDYRAPTTRHSTMRVAVQDSAGQVVAQSEWSGSPVVLHAAAPAGDDSVVVTPVTGFGSAHLTGSYPPVPDTEDVYTLGPETAGTLSASLDWVSALRRDASSGHVDAGSQVEVQVGVSADGTFDASLYWPASSPDRLDLALVGPAGAVVASGSPSGLQAEPLSVPLSTSGSYRLRVSAPGQGSACAGSHLVGASTSNSSEAP